MCGWLLVVDYWVNLWGVAAQDLVYLAEIRWYWVRFQETWTRSGATWFHPYYSRKHTQILELCWRAVRRRDVLLVGRRELWSKRNIWRWTASCRIHSFFKHFLVKSIFSQKWENQAHLKIWQPYSKILDQSSCHLQQNDSFAPRRIPQSVQPFNHGTRNKHPEFSSESYVVEGLIEPYR